jgi:phospholipid transport system substrate-binding protein
MTNDRDWSQTMKQLAAAIFLLFALAAPARAEAMPDQITREATDKILALIKAHRDAYAKDHKRLYAMVDEHVLVYFDFRAMSRSVLGRFWREATEEQRTRFTNEFRDLLVRTYATALLKYNNEVIVYLPFLGKPGDKTVTVKTEVRRADGSPNIPIHYSFYNTDSAWRVYDVSIEGVSLVTNYRSTYATKIQREGVEALIAELARDNKAAAAGKTAAGRKTGAAR